MNTPAIGFSFIFEGEAIAAQPGQTIAAALVAAGRRTHSAARDGAPRGYFCGMGVCHDCLVSIEGRGDLRACLTKAEPGMEVRPFGGLAAPATAAAPDTTAEELVVDILIVGAGPGGLAAAIAARRNGASVLVVDERSTPGGQFYKQPATPALPEPMHDAQSRDGAQLIADAQALGAEILSDTMIWGAFRTPDKSIEMALVSGGESRLARPRAVIVATGAYERPALVPGWTLPGAMTPGGAQALARSHGVLPGKRIVIAGNGPLNLQLAEELLRLGAANLSVVESAPPPWTRPLEGARMAAAAPALAAQGMGKLAALARKGVKIHWSSRLTGIEGTASVSGARIGRLDGSGAVVPGSEQVLPADTVLSSSGFIGAGEIARQLGVTYHIAPKGFARLEADRGPEGTTDLRDVFIVGEAGAFGGAHVAMAQGTLAGAAAAEFCGFAPREDAAARTTLARHTAFQQHLWSLFEAPPEQLDTLPDETIICRCEAISLGALRKARGALTVESVQGLKHLSRVGMGRCQGRYCGPLLKAALGSDRPETERDILLPQVPVRPVTAAAIARHKPEWLGHKREDLPEFPPAPAGAPLPVGTIDVAVIGGGIAGISTALFLARGGASVAVLESGRPNGMASGGNAGSLHGQLLSFDFAKIGKEVTPQIATLGLQRHAIELWQSLQAEFDADFEMAITGGLMMAETPAEMDRLAAKAEVEQSQGIDTVVIGPEELYRREPGLAPGFLGAAYCSMEGKINPLLATHTVLAAALRADASLHAGTTVTAIAREAGGYRLETNRGTLRAGRVVNAAGAFAGRVGALLGLDVPVHGAPLQMLVTEAAQPMVSHLLAHASRHLTLKQAKNGNLLIGGGWSAGLDQITRRPRTLRDSVEGNLAVAQSVLPGTGGLKVLRSWAAMNIDIDGAPILGEHPDSPGLYTAVGANGYTMGPLFGRLTAELILKGESSIDISRFTVRRFRAA